MDKSTLNRMQMHAGNRAANTEEAISEFEQSRIPLNEGKGGTKTKERQRGEASLFEREIFGLGRVFAVLTLKQAG